MSESNWTDYLFGGGTALSMGLQAYSGIQQQKGYRRASRQVATNALADIGEYRYQQGLAMSESASIEKEMLRHAGSFPERQKAQAYAQGVRGGASREALIKESKRNFNADIQKMKLGYALRGMTLGKSARGVVRKAKGAMKGLRTQSRETLMTNTVGMFDTGVQYAGYLSEKSRRRPPDSGGHIQSYYPTG